ncbi:MAG TPA: MlaD family protein [Longimicrobiales bacterium]|nr:MlaD family protein [Longimicrobiales bacterium]
MAPRSIRKGFDWGRVRVAALIVVALLMLVFAVYKAGEVFDVFADRYELITLLPDAAGLREGNAVTVAGQRIGEVEEIEFIPLERQRGGHHLQLRLSVASEVREQIRGDSRTRVRAQGVLGDKFLDISPGTAGARVLMPGDTLESDTPIDYEEVLARAAGMIDEAETVIVNLQEVTGSIARGEGALGQLLTDDVLYERVVLTTTELARTLHDVNTSDGTIGRLLHDPAIYNRLSNALASLDSLTGTLTRSEGTLGRLVHSDSLYNALTGTAARADSVLAQMETLAQGMHSGEGTIARLVNDPQLYDELLKSVVDLQTLLLDIRENPDRYSPRIDIF